MTHADIIKVDKITPPFGAAGPVLMQYLVALILTVFASAIAVGVDSAIAIPNVSMIYVVPVVIAAAAFGTGPSLFSAVLGALSYNYFLTEPRYTFTVNGPANIWAIGLLFLVGLIVSGVAFVSSRKASEAAELQRQAEILQRFGTDMTAIGSMRSAASLTSGALSALFAAPAVVMVVLDGQLQLVHGTDVAELNQAERDAAHSALSTGTTVHSGVYPDLQSRFDFWPVMTGGSAVAVIGVVFPPDERPALADMSIDVVRSLFAMAMSRKNANEL